MHVIELINKGMQWYGDDGVVMVIKARIAKITATTLSPIDAMEDLVGYYPLSHSGSTEIYISISGLGEVSGDVGSEGLWYVRKWLDSNGLMSEWGRESVKYTSTLSRINLPTAPHYVSGRSGYLSYSLKLEGKGLTVALEVDVDHEKAVIDVELVRSNQKIEWGRVTITGPVTTDSVKAVVSRVLDSIWELLDLPLEAN